MPSIPANRRARPFPSSWIGAASEGNTAAQSRHANWSALTEADRNRDLPSVRGAKADPLVLDLIEMDGGIVLNGSEIEVLGGQPADRRHHGIGGNDPVALGGHQTDPGV